MRLSTLALQNFRNLRDYKLQADGRNVNIYGPNGAGKSAIASAIFWVLFGSDVNGKADFNIKTTEDGEALHYLDYSAELSFVMDDGELALGRTYNEKWGEERKCGYETLNTHTTKYSIDGEGKLKRDYDAYIDSLCDPFKFRVLTDPAFLLSDRVDWRQRRTLFFEMVGDMTDAEVIAATPELSDLPELMGKHSIDSFAEMSKSAAKKTREERDDTAQQIKGAESMLGVKDDGDWAPTLKGYSDTLAELQTEKAAVEAGGGATPLKAHISAINNEISTIEVELRNKPNPDREKALTRQSNKRNELRQAQREVEELTTDIATKTRRLQVLDREITAKDEARGAKRAEWFAETAKVWSGDSVCATCKQPLPELDIEDAKGEFNSKRAKAIAAIELQGGVLKTEHEALLKDRGSVKDLLAELEVQLGMANEAVTRLQGELTAIVVPNETPIDPNEDSRVIKLVGELSQVQNQLDDIAEDASAALTEINDKIARANAGIERCNNAIAAQKLRAQGVIRIDLLKAKHKDLGAKLEKLDRSVDLCGLFARAKANLLNDKINDMFKLVHIKLFKVLMNGGIESCCEVYWRKTMAVPSTGEGMRACIDIADALGKQLDFYPPIIIDEAQDMTDFPKTRAQQIRFFTSAEDTGIRVEVENPDAITTDKELALV